MAIAEEVVQEFLADMRSWRCPCGAIFGFYREPSFCPYCGQNLSEVECSQPQRDQAVVMFADKIEARLKELRGKLGTQRDLAVNAKTSQEAEIAWTSSHRLEGNIGALEWALRL